MHKMNLSVIFRNRFGHFRSGWRILFYITFVVIVFKILEFLGNSILLANAENLSDYSLLSNRLIDRFLRLLSVFIPGIVLLIWVDRRPVALLGTGLYKGFLRELSIGMFLGLATGVVSVLILCLTEQASFLFNGFSLDILLYLFICLVIAIVSAAYEEILFRGYIFQSLIEGSNLWIALTVFSLLFGAAHIGNADVTVFTIIFTIIAGVCLGVIYFKTRALWMCIGLHFMWNWTIGIIFGMGVSGSKFLRKSLFSYQANVDTFTDIIQGIVLLVLTIFVWKVNWLKPVKRNRKLWAEYPDRYGATPEVSKQSVFAPSSTKDTS